MKLLKYSGSNFNELNDLIESEKVEKLSFEDKHLTFAEHAEFVSRLKVSVFSPLGGAVEELRRIKDASEIELIKKAVNIADDVFTHILKFIKPGVSEIELAAEMEHFMKTTRCDRAILRDDRRLRKKIINASWYCIGEKD